MVCFNKDLCLLRFLGMRDNINNVTYLLQVSNFSSHWRSAIDVEKKVRLLTPAIIQKKDKCALNAISLFIGLSIAIAITTRTRLVNSKYSYRSCTQALFFNPIYDLILNFIQSLALTLN